MDPHARTFNTAPTNVLPAGPPLRTQSPGRSCAEGGCQTALSRYNPDEFCTRHGGWSDETVKRPGRKPIAGGA